MRIPGGRDGHEPTAALEGRLTPQMHPDDAAAVLRARDGDDEAFRLLVQRHSRGLFRLAWRLTGQQADAEDVVQETFIRAFRQLDRFEARSNFATWLYRIAYNCAIDHLRVRPRHEMAAPLEALEGRAPEPHGPAADELVYATEICGRVQAALAALTADARTAFVLRHYEGCSIAEICGAMGLNASAAKHAVFRAVKKMRLALEPLMRRDTRPAARAAGADRRYDARPVTVGPAAGRQTMRRT